MFVGSRSSLKQIKANAVAASIADAALALFDEKGFDVVTVDEIAAAAGISRRSFFRYFPTKEDVVVAGHAKFGTKIADAVRARPEGEDVWSSLRRGYDVLADNTDRDPEAAARTMRVVNGTASLRAHTLEKHIGWAVDLAPEIARRLGGADIHRLEADALVHASFACLDIALFHFTLSPSSSLHDKLDATFDALRSNGVR